MLLSINNNILMQKLSIYKRIGNNYSYKSYRINQEGVYYMRIDYDYYEKEEPVLIERGKGKRNDLLDAIEKASTVSSLRITIQFECGDCCKVIEGGRNINVVGNYVVLTSNTNDLTLRIISNCRTITRRRITSIIIPIDRICSFEFESRC